MTAEDLKLRRQALGMSQESFGKHRMIQRERSLINRWESGTMPIPHWVETALEIMERGNSLSR